MKVGDFQYDFGASFRRVTPSTQVGRLSGPHFELGFQLDSIATMGRMAMERKGAGVSKTVLLNNVFTLTVSVIASRLPACGGKRFGGLSCKDHGNKTWKSGVTA